MEKYTKEGLARQEREKDEEKQRKLAAKQQNKPRKKKEEILVSYPTEYYEYDTGGAEAGHYYSYAQSSDGK